MQKQIEVAALVVLLTVTTIGKASDPSTKNDETPNGTNGILSALGIRESEGGSGEASRIDITKVAWIAKDRLGIQVVGESKTEPRGLFGVLWDRRQVAEIELVEMPPAYCAAVNASADNDSTPCYLVAGANEHDELKAPFGAWHATDEEIQEIYTGLPSVGNAVHIRPETLSAALP